MRMTEKIFLGRRMLTVEEIGDQIIREIWQTGASAHIFTVLDRIRRSELSEESKNWLYTEIRAAELAAVTLYQNLYDHINKRENPDDILQKAREEAEKIRLNAQAEAVEIRNRAHDESREIRESAHRAADKMLEDARRYIAQEREQAHADLEREMDQLRREKLDQAQKLYDEQKEQFKPAAIKEAISDYRRADSAAYAANADVQKRMVSAFEDTRTAVCGGMTEMQAQINEQLNGLRENLTRSMMDWREQLYSLETMPLAQCVVNLSAILAGVDVRMSEAAVRDETRTVETLAIVRRNLSRFEKQLSNAMASLGMEVYQPQPGELFDPARHVLSDSEKDVDPDVPMMVSRCVRPGVRGANEAMIRAEVEASEVPNTEPPTPEAPVCEQTVKIPPITGPWYATPHFDQIVPEGDA